MLVHGLDVSGTYFDRLALLLAQDRRVLALDLPGWGRSERPTRALDIGAAAQVLAGLLLADPAVAPTVVANSFGCQIVIELARMQPDLVGPIALISPTVDPHYRSWSRQSGTLLVDWCREPPALWPIIVRDYWTMEPRRVVATARFALDDRPEEKLPELKSRVLVLRGDRDALTTRAWSERCASLAPNGSFEPVVGAAHAAHFSHPQRVAELINTFLTKPDGRSSRPGNP